MFVLRSADTGGRADTGSRADIFGYFLDCHTATTNSTSSTGTRRICEFASLHFRVLIFTGKYLTDVRLRACVPFALSFADKLTAHRLSPVLVKDTRPVDRVLTCSPAYLHTFALFHILLSLSRVTLLAGF